MKETARQKRGKDVRRRVSGEIKIPRYCQAFLRIDENKTKLFHFLAEFVLPQPFKYIATLVICNGLGNDKAKALLGFHCFTGCDTVSAFHGKGKKSAWETWKVYGEVAAAFLALSSATVTITRNVMTVLERYVIPFYDRTSGDIHIDQFRKHLFSSKGRYTSH